MTKKRILFDRFEFPRMGGLKYVFDEKKTVTDYLFVNEPHEEFSMYFENDFPTFKVPENIEGSYCTFEVKRPGRTIRFFCPEKHQNLDFVVWYFHVELFDGKGEAYALSGQVRIDACDLYAYLSKGRPKFLEVLEQIQLTCAS